MTFTQILQQVDDWVSLTILLIILAAGGFLFSFRTRFVQIRHFKESCRLIAEPPHDAKRVTSFQALMVSTASRVGTGNIAGVASALCIGGAGSLFWMWFMCIIGAASAFTESTLAQIYKKKDEDGNAFGGPAYYIEKVMKGKRWLSLVFCFFLLMTYSFGFNLLASYNLQETFATYSFYNKWTPIIVGAVLAALAGYCLFGGGKRILKITSTLVPAMGIFYVIVSLIVIITHFRNIPHMFGMIFSDAFDFRSIFGGFAGSCMVLGVKRGLFSNEAGVGSAPNASASAHVSHPVKQGLVQTVSVYIDTMLLCTATGLMCLSSGAEFGPDIKATNFVQAAVSSTFGKVGPVFITIAMALFAFTTLLGNLYYADNALAYWNHKQKPGKKFMTGFYIYAILVIFIGASLEAEAVWALADLSMAGMVFINIPIIAILSKQAVNALKDYEKQKKAGQDPVFRLKDIGLDPDEFDFWN
ncbi:MAG: alanine:cation symporter family protein [Clostridia bacterium]|nr:alanine:cation symporter family protein [Clostridia bacterium]